MKEADSGILYVATGTQHRAEALASATRCKILMPTIPMAVWTDRELRCDLFEIVEVFSDPNYDYMDKVIALGRSPFRRTLYLDTDTFVCMPVHGLFDLLDHFDLAAAHASNRQSTRSTYSISGVPDCFPEMNTGVVIYKSSEGTDALFARWLRLFNLDRARFSEATLGDCSRLLKPPGDQSSFREALFKSDIRIATLPPEYNFRFGYSAFAGSSIRILHGRHKDLSHLASLVNSDCKRRCYVPGLGILRPQTKYLPPDAL